MSAYPVVTVVCYEDGYRLALSVEECEGATAELRLCGAIEQRTSDGELRFLLNTDAAEVLANELTRLVDHLKAQEDAVKP